MVYAVASKLRAVVAAAFFGLLAYFVVRRALRIPFVSDRLASYAQRLNKFSELLKRKRDKLDADIFYKEIDTKRYLHSLLQKTPALREVGILIIALTIPVVAYYLEPFVIEIWQKVVYNTRILSSDIFSALYVIFPVSQREFFLVANTGLKLVGGALILRAFLLERESARLDGLLSVVWSNPPVYSLIRHCVEVSDEARPRIQILLWVLERQMRDLINQSQMIAYTWRDEFPPYKTLDRSATRDVDRLFSYKHPAIFERGSTPSTVYYTEVMFDIVGGIEAKLRRYLNELRDLNRDDNIEKEYNRYRSSVKQLSRKLYSHHEYWRSYLETRRKRIDRNRVQLYVAGFLLATVLSPLPEAITKLFTN